MSYLFLDTTDHLIVGVLDELFSWQSFRDIADKKSSTKVHSIIDEELKKHNTEIAELNGVFLVSGPGSYTGMRVSEGIAQFLKWQNIEIFSFYHFEVPSLLGEKGGSWFSNAFKKEFFCYRWSEDTSEKKLLSSQDLLSFISDNEEESFYVNFLSDEYLNIFSSHQVTSTGDEIRNKAKELFPKVKDRGLHLGPYYYRAESEEFKTK